MCAKVADEPGGQPGPRGRRRVGRCLTYWAGGAVLVALLSGLLAAAEATDFHDDRGPLSLPSSAAVAQPFSPRSVRILSLCFGPFPRDDPYRVASAIIDGSPVYACYQFTGYGGLNTSVVNARGVSVQDVELLERYGAWRWVDPYPPFVRVLTAALAAAFLLLEFLYARLARAPVPGRLRSLAFVPLVGVGVVRVQGLGKEVRRRLFLLHLLPYLVIGGIAIVAFGSVARPVTPLNAVCAWLLVAVGLYALLAGRMLPSREPEAAAPSGPFPARPAAGPPPQLASPATTAAPAQSANRTWVGDVGYTDISREAAAVRQLYYLALAIKCFAFVFGALLLGSSGPPSRDQILSAVLLFTGLNVVAFLLENSKITPLASIAGPVIIFMASLGVYAAIFRPALLPDVVTVVFWLPMVVVYLEYRRAARRSGVSDRDIQAALCAGHLRPSWRTGPSGPGRLSLMILPRLVFGLVGAAIVVVLSILNTVLGTAIPVIPAAIQFLLDFLFAGTRKLMGASASSPGAADDPVIAYTQSTDPEQWSVSVRGDVFRFGKFFPQQVPFEDFLVQRLSVYGRPVGLGKTPIEITAADAAAGSARLVVVAVGSPIPEPEINAAVELMGNRPWLLVFYPADGHEAQRLWQYGITLPAVIDWTGALGLLHVPPKMFTVLRAESKQQWQHLVVVLRHAASASGLLPAPDTAVVSVPRSDGAGQIAVYGSVVAGDIPQPPPGFQLRADLLAALDAAGPGVSVVHAVTGMRGAGKTQLAAAYARAKLAAGWRLVAWVNAGDSGSLLAGLTAVAEAAGLAGEAAGDAGLAVRHWLEADGDRRLIVFDDAADADVLRPYVPVGGAARVLITSNGQSVANLGARVGVEVFTRDEALAFLADRTGRPSDAGAEAAAAELGYLPLALAQAAAVIAAQHLPYSTYLERLRALPAGEDLAQDEGQPYPHGVAGAVLLSLDAVRAGDQAGACSGVMEMMAVLSAAGVRRNLLQDAGLAGVLATGRRARAAKTSAGLVDKALAQLAERSLLTFSLDGQVVTAHRVVLRIIREGLARQGRFTAVCRAAAAALFSRAQALSGSLDRRAVRDIAEQVTALHNAAARWPGRPDDELDRLLLGLRQWAVYNLNELGVSAPQAIAVGEPLTADFERVLGPDHPRTLASRNDLANAYLAAGRAAEATPLFERTLADSERVLGSDHPDTLISRNNLAGSYLAAGRAAEAIPLFERPLAVWERVLGPDHPRTLTSRNNLAESYLAAGRAAEAIPLFEQTLAVRKRVLGPDHPDTLTSRNNLAAAYVEAGRAG